MKKELLLACLLVAGYLQAQPPPTQLPSLLDGATIQMPVLHQHEDPEAFIRKNIFVKIWASKTSAYVGEPLLVTYKLYTSLNSQARVGKQPAFSGCSVTELSTEREPDEATVNGKLFHVFIIRKVQVIPLQQGSLQLGPASVDNVVQLLNEDGTAAENYSVTVENESLAIGVKPLPEAGKPEDFSGLVGDYRIEASLDSDRLPAGENGILRVRISGKGNIAAIHLPSFTWPAGTEHFDGSDSQHVNLDDFPVSGDKIFEIPFIGDREGKVVLQPITLSYFDPVAGLYKTTSTSSLPVVFTKPVSKVEQLKNIVTEDVTNRKYLWIVGAIAAALLLTWYISTTSKKQHKSVRAMQAPADDLSSAEPVSSEKVDEKKINPEQVFTELNQLGSINASPLFFSSTRVFLVKALQSKLQTGCISEHELIVTMKQKDEYTDIAIACEDIFDTCNRNLYCPLVEDDTREKVYFELTSVVKRMYQLS